MSGQSIFARGIKVTNAAVNHGAGGRWRVELNDPATYHGFGDIAVGSDDTLYLVYSSRARHESADGVLKAATSTDYGATWTNPVTLLSPSTGRDLRDATITIDPVTGLFHIVVNDCAKVEGASPDVLRILRGPSLTSLTDATITQPYTLRSFARSKIHRLNIYMYLAACGRDTGDSVLHPAMMISSDDGATWTPQKTFPTEAGNESCLYFARTAEAPMDYRMFLLTRHNTSGNRAFVQYTDYAGEFGSTYQGPFNLPFGASGGPAVFQMDGYLMMIARHDRRGQHGFVSYSLNGLDWTLPELFTPSRPVYGSLVQFPDGRVLVMTTQEWGTGAVNASMFLQWFVPPSFAEVVARLDALPAVEPTP